MVIVVVVVAKLNAHTENATVLLHAGPEAHSFSHQSSSADEADQGKGGGVTLGSVPVFSQGHRVYSCCPAASWGFWNFIERITSFFLAVPLRNVSPFRYLTVVL